MIQKAALVLNGEVYRGRIKEDYIVCADNGYSLCEAMGVKPQAIVGDMDSIDCVVPDDIEIIRFSANKDETDGELALRFLISRGYRRINIYGADGGRLDHVLGNISLMYQASRLGARAVLKTNLCDVYFVTSPFEHEVEQGETLSIIPYSDSIHVVSTSGLRYPLSDATINKGSTLGISNVCVADSVEVVIDRGEALIARVFEKDTHRFE